MAETKKTTTKTATAAKKTTTAAKASTSSTKSTATKATTAKTTTTKAPAKKAAAPKVEAPVVEEVKVEVAPVEVKATKAPVKKVQKGPQLQIKLVKSKSGRLEKQIKTLTALGLNKINQTVVKPDNAATRGMIFVVKHLVEVTEIK